MLMISAYFLFFGWILLLFVTDSFGFAFESAGSRSTELTSFHRWATTSSVICATSNTAAEDGTQLLITDNIPTDFHALLLSAENATTLRPQETTKGAHDAFRFEWGTWVVESNLQFLMEQMNSVRINDGVYQQMTGNRHPRRLLVASGDQWDILLHCLPNDQSWQGQWPEGSWAILKALTGVVEIAAMKGPDRDGLFQKKTSKDLRGGSDGSMSIGNAGGGKSFGGEDAIKYLGGPLRRYTAKTRNTMVLEAVIRPPVKYDRKDIIESLPNLTDTFTIVAADDTIVEDEEDEASQATQCKLEDNEAVVNGSGHLGKSIGMSFDNVGGLDKQLDAIVRRVLASRANPEAARRLGVNHVRGILLSGPPGCGKTLMARELANLLGAREPQIVNGPEILDKFIGEAEKKVRDLFGPAEREWREVGEDSMLHVIILDEMDAIARKRGSMSSDTTGVRDSVVNQLLAKMDGVKQANNVLVIGLTNRPELLDPALLRPGRLEVQLRVELPDLSGRRDILRIHTRRMMASGALSDDAIKFIEDLDENGLPAKTEHFTGAELAGLVRSAASFALARSVGMEQEGVISTADIDEALREVRPALGKQDETLKLRYPFGIVPYSPSMERVMRDLERFVSPSKVDTFPLNSMLLVGGGPGGGAGSTALAAWAATQASTKGSCDYVRFISALDLLSGQTSGDTARASALIDRFGEATELQHSLLVLDDVDQLCAGNGQNGYSTVMVAALRALLRSPPSRQVGREGSSNRKSLRIIGTTSRSDAACAVLHEIFDETVVVPLLSDANAVERLLNESPFSAALLDTKSLSTLLIDRLGPLDCKTVLRLGDLVIRENTSSPDGQLQAMTTMLDDMKGDVDSIDRICEF